MLQSTQNINMAEKQSRGNMPTTRNFGRADWLRARSASVPRFAFKTTYSVRFSLACVERCAISPVPTARAPPPPPAAHFVYTSGRSRTASAHARNNQKHAEKNEHIYTSLVKIRFQNSSGSTKKLTQRSKRAELEGSISMFHRPLSATHHKYGVFSVCCLLN